MSSGGLRPKAGRKGLSQDEKREVAALVAQHIEAGFDERERRAFMELVRAHQRGGGDEAREHYDEFMEHYACIAWPDGTTSCMTDEEWQALFAGRQAPSSGREALLADRQARARMTEEEWQALLADRKDYVNLSRRGPAATPIGALFEELRQRRGIGRLLSVPPPTKNEMGRIHQEVADALGSRLGRRISRRQVANACRDVAELDRKLGEEADRLMAEQPDSSMRDDELIKRLPDEPWDGKYPLK